MVTRRLVTNRSSIRSTDDVVEFLGYPGGARRLARTGGGVVALDRQPPPSGSEDRPSQALGARTAKSGADLLNRLHRVTPRQTLHKVGGDPFELRLVRRQRHRGQERVLGDPEGDVAGDAQLVRRDPTQKVTRRWIEGMRTRPRDGLGDGSRIATPASACSPSTWLSDCWRLDASSPMVGSGRSRRTPPSSLWGVSVSMGVVCARRGRSRRRSICRPWSLSRGPCGATRSVRGDVPPGLSPITCCTGQLCCLSVAGVNHPAVPQEVRTGRHSLDCAKCRIGWSSLTFGQGTPWRQGSATARPPTEHR